MKTVKRALALVLALTLLLAMSATVFAADDTTYTITINNTTAGSFFCVEKTIVNKSNTGKLDIATETTENVSYVLTMRNS